MITFVFINTIFAERISASQYTRHERLSQWPEDYYCSMLQYRLRRVHNVHIRSHCTSSDIPKNRGLLLLRSSCTPDPFKDDSIHHLGLVLSVAGHLLWAQPQRALFALEAMMQNLAWRASE